MTGLPGLTPFVGRERELAELLQHLEAARQGQGRVALVAGEPGIGKTRLLSELADQARAQGWQVLSGGAYESEGLPPYLPFAEALRDYIHTTRPDDLRALLGAGAAEIALVVPEIHRKLADVPVSSPLGPQQGRYRLFESVTDFLLTLAQATESRGLLLLEDLHWADDSTLLLLRHLARRLAGVPLLLAGSYRDVEVTWQHPLARTLAELARLPEMRQLTLSGLVEREVGRFIELTIGQEPSPQLTAAVYLETEGNPFFVTEVVRLLESDGRLRGFETKGLRALALPERVREVIGERLVYLSPACNQVLTIAAVIGQEFSIGVLERVNQLAGEQLLEVLEEAETARMIAGEAGALGRYCFVHALIRQTLYEDVPSTRRPRLHGQVAGALESYYGADPEPHVAELAYHLVQAAPGGDADKAIRYAVRAGERASRLLAYEEAGSHYRAALQVLELSDPTDEQRRCELLLALAEAQTRAGDRQRARQTALQAAGIARELSQWAQFARAALAFSAEAEALIDEESIAVLEEALARLGSDEDVLHVKVLSRLASNLTRKASVERAHPLSRQAVQLAQRIRDPVAMPYALSARHLVLDAPEHIEERLAVAGEILKLVAETGDRELELEGHRWRIPDLLELGDIRAVDAEIGEHARLARGLRQPLYLWRSAVWQAMRASMAGQFSEGERLAQEALAHGQRAAPEAAARLYLSHIAYVRRDQGRFEEIAAAIEETAARYGKASSVWATGVAWTHAKLGHREEARHAFERALSSELIRLPQDGGWLVALSQLAEVCSFLRDRDCAALLYTLLSPYARRSIPGGWGVVYAGSASRYLGLLGAGMGRWSEAEGHFREAIETETKVGAWPWLARAERDYAAMLLERDRPGDRERARPLLERALQTAATLGMSRLAERCQALVAGPALPATSPTPVYPDGLTAREVEVLCLLAAGRSHQQIAGELLLSIRTVGRHVTNLYTKIGAHNKADAIAYAYRHHLAQP